MGGPAIGSGADLALACDVRLAVPTAEFRFPGPTFGLVLGIGRAAEVLGCDLALSGYVFGQPITAAQAHRVGGIAEIVSPQLLPARVDELTARAGALPPGTVPALVAGARSGDRRDTLPSIAAAELPDRVRRFADEVRGRG